MKIMTPVIDQFVACRCHLALSSIMMVITEQPNSSSLSAALHCAQCGSHNSLCTFLSNSRDKLNIRL